MGQSRTALIFGADLTDIELPEEYWDYASRHRGLPRSAVLCAEITSKASRIVAADGN